MNLKERIKKFFPQFKGEAEIGFEKNAIEEKEIVHYRISYNEQAVAIHFNELFVGFHNAIMEDITEKISEKYIANYFEDFFNNLDEEQIKKSN